jgi:hypothetical protein
MPKTIQYPFASRTTKGKKEFTMHIIRPDAPPQELLGYKLIWCRVAIENDDDDPENRYFNVLVTARRYRGHVRLETLAAKLAPIVDARLITPIYESILEQIPPDMIPPEGLSMPWRLNFGEMMDVNRVTGEETPISETEFERLWKEQGERRYTDEISEHSIEIGAEITDLFATLLEQSVELDPAIDTESDLCNRCGLYRPVNEDGLCIECWARALLKPRDHHESEE